MPAAIVVAGAAPVYIDAGAGLELLGYTVNGVDSVAEAFWLDVPGDQNGGDSGPPIDIQNLGEIVRVRLEFSKWDATVAAKIRARVRGGTAGTPPTPGVLAFAGTLYYRLLINSPTIPENYPYAIPRHAQEINRGTRWSRFVAEFECHKGNGSVVYNQTTS